MKITLYVHEWHNVSRGLDRMVDGLATTSAISAEHH